MSLTLPNAIDAAADSRDDNAFFEVVWRDTESDATGYVVIDRLVRGVSSGGLRMRAGCTIDEVRGLARGMTLKEGVHYEPGAAYVPLGGAKGGIDFDPYHPDADGVLRRFLQATAPIIATRWTMGEDFGVQQTTIDGLLPEVGLTSSIQAAEQVVDDPAAAQKRMAAAFASVVDGVSLDELVGGFGVAKAALAAMARRNMARAATTAVIQGFGSMGGATARYLAEAGVRVVGIVDVEGVVYNPAGLDVEALLLSRSAKGNVDRSRLRPEDQQLDSADWLSIEADVLVPAAISYCINDGNQAQVRARLIVEAANMPVTPEAEQLMAARGIEVSPDFVANSATNAWWWWVFFGDVDGTPEQSFRKIEDRMTALSDEMFDIAEADGISLRAAAFEMASRRLAVISADLPIY
ncbi:Glu/Leu/Phe/Val dehydrogenase dimerization domain-containing protein [Gordonia neofelifaecis]|uniref:Glutamate dehydrogenase n=1 Tax=Gordonia neofelifaecis NRRL B-59395 TaxID=644548 RepID=F1YJ19_9ACTN|nr:Glu/Leu/Phe/Val dehydrogenase dimerization domain-containing protein [Gordonia neofelifaecis]EGD55477.1 glutamate dehydrogenase (NAD(P)+) [Gordonia neofelifaecis NRRL B-59395]